MAKVKVDQLDKSYGDLKAVEGLSFSINDGEFLVIVGPSGCGKSTTLDVIAGLESPTSGKIWLGDEDITELAPQDRDIAMVFQNYALYPHMSVQENMSFGLKMSSDYDKETIQEKVQEMASLLGISELLDDKPKELSGGQQQRVALGRAVIREPEVFLLDEPLSNLDAKLRTEMRTELQQIQNNLGITTVYVTHDQIEAMTMGDRIAVLNEGQLQQIDAPLELYYNPANRFVASFIGSPSMNFFDVTKSIDGNDTVLEHDLFTYRISEDIESLLDSRRDLVLGIRPEMLQVAKRKDENVLEAEIDVVEPMGETNYVYFSDEINTYTVSLPPEDLPSVGDTTFFAFDENDLYLFDSQTGETIKSVSSEGRSLPNSNKALTELSETAP